MSPKHVTEFAARLVDQTDVPLKVSSDEAPPHRVQDVLLHDLEILQLVALYMQFDAHLSKLRT